MHRRTEVSVRCDSAADICTVVRVAASNIFTTRLIVEVSMKINVGSVDRGIRIVLGILLLSLLWILDTDFRYIGLIGIIPIATALAKSCPLYTLMGINTGPAEQPTEK